MKKHNNISVDNTNYLMVCLCEKSCKNHANLKELITKTYPELQCGLFYQNDKGEFKSIKELL